MSSKNYVSSQGYSIEIDDLCRWYLKKNDEAIANAITPYPLVYKALNEKLITLAEALEIAKIYDIPPKYIDSSLSELEAK